MLRTDDILKLLLTSDQPVQLKIVAGRVNRAIVRADDRTMQEGEFKRMMEQIMQRCKHGTLTAYRQDGRIVVQWEESVIVGERR